jgi:hypothetical protein
MSTPKAKPHAGGRGVLESTGTRASDSDKDNTAAEHDAPDVNPALRLVPCAATGELSGDKPALIPAGEYQLRMNHWETAIYLGRAQKVVLHFTVCDMGPFFGIKLMRYYNVERIIGKPGKHGRFKVRWNHDLVRDYSALFPEPRRLDRIDLDHFASVIVVGRVETVTTTTRQKPLPASAQYSVVRELLRLEAGH